MAQRLQLPDREWSYAVLGDEVPSQGMSLDISPSASEMKAIAQRLDILSLDALQSSLRLERQNGHVVKVSGSFKADVTQRCVVTLEPVQAHLSDEFEAWYANHDQAAPFRRAQHDALTKKEMIDLPMLEEDEDPEPMEDGKIDLAELTIQYLSLALDPYPHKPGVDYENKEPLRKVQPKESLRPNPFAALKNWRPKD